MLIYLFILLLILFSSLLHSHKLTNFDKFIFIILALISGFRFEVGTDFNAYVGYFDLVANGYSSPAEIGFDILANIVSTLGFNAQILFLVLSSLTMFFFFKGAQYYFSKGFIYKPIFYIIFLIFVYFSSFNAVRQILAAAIIFYASKYIIEKNFIAFAFWVLLAMTFHFSSIVFLVVYFIINKNYSRVTLLSTIILSVILATNNVVSDIMLQITVNYTFLDIGGYISNYLTSTYNERNVELGIVFFINTFLLLSLIFFKRKYIKFKWQNMMLNYYCLYISFLFLAIDAFVLARFQYFLSIYMAVAISSVIPMFDKDSQKFVKLVSLLLYIFLYIYTIISGYANPDSTDIIPYQFNFDIFK